MYFLYYYYYMVRTHIMSFAVVKSSEYGQVTYHCRRAWPYRADLSLFLNVQVFTVTSEITVWGRLFQTVDEVWQKELLHCSGLNLAFHHLQIDAHFAVCGWSHWRCSQLRFTAMFGELSISVVTECNWKGIKNMCEIITAVSSNS